VQNLGNAVQGEHFHIRGKMRG